MSLILGDAAVPIVLRCLFKQGVLRAEGSYQRSANLPFPCSSDYVRQQIMILAAGGIAEEIYFGEHTDGVKHDHSVIEWILQIAGRREFLQERSQKYPASRDVLEKNWLAVTRIAEIALRRFCLIDAGSGPFENTQVLSATAVQRIFADDALTQEEFAIAQQKAYWYAGQRNNGSSPEYDLSFAINDFEMAAGDVLGSA